jgi:RNA polymerase sigma-70 factor, ECF subfamily
MDSGAAPIDPCNPTDVGIAGELRATLGRTDAGLRDLSDDSLMFRLLDAVYPRDIDALFGELYSRYHSRVKVWCRRFTRDPQRADDMAQEVFMRAFRYRNSFRGESRTSTWLFTVTRNYCLTAIRKANADPSTAAVLLDPRLKGASGFETHRQMELDEAFLHVWKLLNTALTPAEARVMVLHYGHGLPLALITRRLALTNPSGAKAHIVNAKRKLGLLLARTGRVPNRRSMGTGSAALAA